MNTTMTWKVWVNVILARDIDEMNVNNHIPEYIEAWNGNIDWLPVFDVFAVVTYVTEQAEAEVVPSSRSVKFKFLKFS